MWPGCPNWPLHVSKTAKAMLLKRSRINKNEIKTELKKCLLHILLGEKLILTFLKCQGDREHI